MAERGFIRVFDIATNLRGHAVATNTTVLVLGVTAVNDGGGGLFYWDSASNAADDGTNTIAVNGFSGNGRWVRVRPRQIEIAGTTVDLALGTDFWKNTTSNLTLALSNASDGKKASISIRNTGASPATVDITGVPFPDGAPNEIPAGGRAHISLKQINGIMDASIVIYS